jgi:DNA-binding response OmpR family regulator
MAPAPPRFKRASPVADTYDGSWDGGGVTTEQQMEARDQPVVLLAEDDPDVGDLVRHVLEADGYQVQLARDGAEALDRFEASCPDLVVLDVMMPRLTGFEVLARLRECEAEGTAVPVLILSARTSQDDIVKGFELGVTDYVTKPFMIGELRARVRSLLARA